jgi:hypothetical protein
LEVQQIDNHKQTRNSSDTRIWQELWLVLPVQVLLPALALLRALALTLVPLQLLEQGAPRQVRPQLLDGLGRERERLLLLVRSFDRRR